MRGGTVVEFHLLETNSFDPPPFLCTPLAPPPLAGRCESSIHTRGGGGREEGRGYDADLAYIYTEDKKENGRRNFSLFHLAGSRLYIRGCWRKEKRLRMCGKLRKYFPAFLDIHGDQSHPLICSA